MIDIRTITEAAYNQIRDNAMLASYEVERSQRINTDPGRCPWIGVYPGAVSTEPHTLATTIQKWRSKAEVQIVVQTSSFVDDGQAASDQLEDIVQAVHAQIDTDLTLGVSNCRIVGLSREYRYVVYDDDGQGSIFMPQAIIKVSMEIRGSV